ncbi:hypothetical protein LA080_006295 [Diaporthe eres]|nr:hypothetical protein LA080_006295 [Diaporthe eres]
MAYYQLLTNLVSEHGRRLIPMTSRNPGVNSFVPFRDLPGEIRVKIWKASLPAFAPCTFKLEHYSQDTCCITPTLETQYRISAIRALLLACKESRDEIEKLYPQLLHLKSGAMRWNSATDIFMSDPSQQLHLLQTSSTSDFIKWNFYGYWNQDVWNFGCYGERLKEIHQVPVEKYAPYSPAVEYRNGYSVDSELLKEHPLAPSPSADPREQARVDVLNERISRSWTDFLIHIAVFPNLRSFLIVLPNQYHTRDWLKKGASWGDVQMLSHTLCGMPGLFAWGPVPEQNLERHPVGANTNGIFASKFEWFYEKISSLLRFFCSITKKNDLHTNGIFAGNFEWFYEEMRSRLRFFCSVTERNDLKGWGRVVARSIRTHIPPKKLQKLVNLPIYIIVETDDDLSEVTSWATLR